LRIVRDGIAAAPGIVIGPAHLLRWELPKIDRSTIEAAEVDAEVECFHEALAWAKARIRDIQQETADRLGRVEAQIFEPQLLMLEDGDLISGTVSYIRENHLSAPRAFELRMLEFRSAWRRTGHPMVMDRLNDLADVELRVIYRLRPKRR
jgi:phosphoenolpyruvate-protein phosphotransferase (PTS system enzyme I)